MALFGKKKALQRALDGDWNDHREREEILEELRKTGLSPKEAIPLIAHRSAAFREIGMAAFARNPTAADVRDVILQLARGGVPTRGLGARLLASANPDLATKGINELIEHKAAQVRRLAWDFALSLSGPAGIAFVQRAMKEAPAAVRLVAIQRLPKEATGRDVVEMLLGAASDRDQNVASAALERLATVPDAIVLDLMVDRFAHGDAVSRARAQTYLREAVNKQPTQLREQVIPLLGEGEDSVRRGAVELLLMTGSPDVVLLDILLFSKDLVGWLRGRIMETLLTLGDEILEPAIKLLEHPDEAVQTMSLVLAERFDDPRVVPPVCKLLDEDDWWLRISACDTLGRLQDKRAVPFLVKALDDDDTRWAAIDALAALKSPESFQHLIRLLRDKRVEVRVEVVRAVARIEGKDTAKLLRKVAEKDPSSAVRTHAIEALRQFSQTMDLDIGGLESTGTGISAGELKNPLDRLLARIREMGASDLHVTVGEPPLIRVHGKLSRLDDWKPIDARVTTQAITSVLGERHRQELNRNGQADFCYSIPDIGRYRGNAYIQRKGPCASFRVIPNVPPTFADIRLPGHLTELLDYHQGIIVVSGSASCGKSTTLTALVNLINESKPVHVITLEDPVEFVHPVKAALINQREVGKHTTSFGKAIRAALREDPDVVMVGEMRDTETMRMALMAAETGHLVIATLHTTSAVQTIERLIKAFPPDEQPQVRMTLSETLKYVVCQQLLPRADGVGRVALFEILKNTFSVASMIREDKTFQIPNLMQLGYRIGMRTLDVALMELVESGQITPELAWSRALSPADFEGLCDPRFIAEARSALVEQEATT